MSPLKIAIAAFMMGLIGLTASAGNPMNKAGSSSGLGPDYGAKLTTISDDCGNTRNFEYKPVSRNIRMKDVAKVLKKNEMNDYKSKLITLYKKRTDEEGLVANRVWLVGKKSLDERKLLASIEVYENRAYMDKMDRARSKARARQLVGAQAGQLNGAQAEREIDLEYDEEAPTYSSSSSPGHH